MLKPPVSRVTVKLKLKLRTKLLDMMVMNVKRTLRKLTGYVCLDLRIYNNNNNNNNGLLTVFPRGGSSPINTTLKLS